MTSPSLTTAIARPGTLKSLIALSTTASKPSSDFFIAAAGSAARDRENSVDLPPWVNVPLIVEPSAESFPLKDGSPGTPGDLEGDRSPASEIPSSGRSLVPCAGIVMSPAQPVPFGVKSMS